MIVSPLLRDLPATLWWPLLAAATVPAGIALLVLRAGQGSLAARLTGRTAAIMAGGFALMAAVATLGVLEAGISQLTRAQRPVTLATAAALTGAPVATLSLEDALPELALARARHAEVIAIGIRRLDCAAACADAVGEDGTGAALAAWLGSVAATRPAGRLLTLARRQVLLSAAAVRDPEGVPIAQVVVATDAAEAVAQARRVAWLLAAMGTALLALATPVARRMFAVSVGQRVQRLVAELERSTPATAERAPPPSDGADELRLLARRLREHVRHSLDEQRRRDERFLEERRVLERQLQHAQKMDAVGRLTGGIAHDFNNLLTVVIANAELIAQAEGAAAVREEAIEVREAAARGAALVRKLLAFSRPETIALRPVRLPGLLHGFAYLARRTIPATIAFELAEPVPDVELEADPIAIEQALLNLVTNARDAMPDGGRLVIRAEPCVVSPADAGATGGRPGPAVAIAVRDTGTGMSEETRARAFEPFYTTKGPDEGTGLGLAIVYGIVHHHGGRVTIESAAGEGTCITLVLPLREAPAAAR